MDSSAAAARATGDFAKRLESVENVQRVETVLERDELKSVIRDLMFIELHQASLPDVLRDYAAGGRPEDWDQVREVLEANSPVVERLVSLLEQFDGSLIYRDVETYRELSWMLRHRAGLYRWLGVGGRPTTADDKALLFAIADNFDELVAQIKTVQIRLGHYLADGENS